MLTYHDVEAGNFWDNPRTLSLQRDNHNTRILT